MASGKIEMWLIYPFKPVSFYLICGHCISRSFVSRIIILKNIPRLKLVEDHFVERSVNLGSSLLKNYCTRRSRNFHSSNLDPTCHTLSTTSSIHSVVLLLFFGALFKCTEGLRHYVVVFDWRNLRAVSREFLMTPCCRFA